MADDFAPTAFASSLGAGRHLHRRGNGDGGPLGGFPRWTTSFKRIPLPANPRLVVVKPGEARYRKIIDYGDREEERELLVPPSSSRNRD